MGLVLIILLLAVAVVVGLISCSNLVFRVFGE
jgi:hypothetical protein